METKNWLVVEPTLKSMKVSWDEERVQGKWYDVAISSEESNDCVSSGLGVAARKHTQHYSTIRSNRFLRAAEWKKTDQT